MPAKVGRTENNAEKLHCVHLFQFSQVLFYLATSGFHLNFNKTLGMGFLVKEIIFDKT